MMGVPRMTLRCFEKPTIRRPLCCNSNCRAALAAAIFCFATTTQAEINVYDNDRFKIFFGLDATTAAFTQNNAWFGQDVANIGVETDDWIDFGIVPKLHFTLDRESGAQFFGGISAAVTKTFGESADGLAVGFDDPDAATIEEAYLGWRHNFDDKRSLEIMGGNINYKIGTGFLIKDGGHDGGDRGGFYISKRQAFRRSGLIRFTNGNLLVEGFYLGNNPRQGGIEGELAGVNVEYDFSGRGMIGVTYIDSTEVDDILLGPIFEELSIYDVRGEVKATENLTLSGEYATQTGGGVFEGKGWWGQASYSFSNSRGTPSLAYRYAVVTGDDPSTTDLEGFAPIAWGFTDHAQWYQGEITGDWIFANTNQRTHLIKVSTSLSEKFRLTGLYLKIEIDEPGALGITSDDFGDEYDIYLEWKFNDALFLSAVVAIFDPDDGATQFTGGDKTWSHLMLYARYSF